MRPFFILFLCLCLFPASLYAKNLGVEGHIYKITEIDMIAWMKARLEKLKEDGQLEAFNHRFIHRVKKYALRPTPVYGITTTTEPKVFDVDPTIRVDRNIYGLNGQVIVPKGEVINPFVKLGHPYRWKWAFINADDMRQIRWTRAILKKYPNWVKVVLIEGDVFKAEKELKHRVYFDQGGFYSHKLSIHHVPSLALEKNFEWQVTEFNAGKY